MRIAIDAMGGDHAPREIVRGAIDYALQSTDEISLVGDVPRLEREVAAYGNDAPANVRFVDAPEVIGMEEHPATALRTKRRSSIFVDRPALPAHMATATGPVMLLDVGANVDSSPENLVQFAAMGAIFAEHVLHVRSPRIGLLNIGEEVEKGNELARAAHARLAELDLHFVGNVEAHDLIAHRADVVVCDGFVGNVVLKFFEGITGFIFRAMREDLQQGPIAPIALLALKPGFDRLKARFDYERNASAPLLGVKGVSIVTHGRAKARMIENAIRIASESAEARVPDLIGQWTKEHPALAHRGVRSRIAARLHGDRG
jgi:glycerol-3-phosphate acyltransferase PlsX